MNGTGNVADCPGGVAQLVERLTGSQEVRGFESHRLHSGTIASTYKCRSLAATRARGAQGPTLGPTERRFAGRDQIPPVIRATVEWEEP